MLKRILLYAIATAALCFGLTAGIVACTSAPTTAASANPDQSTIDTLTHASQGLDQAARATDAAFMAGKITRADAQAALSAYRVTQTGLSSSIGQFKAIVAARAASAPASAASGGTQ